MGRGETVYGSFYRWFSDLPRERQEAFAADNPEPLGWEGFYRTITENPWHSGS